MPCLYKLIISSSPCSDPVLSIPDGDDEASSPIANDIPMYLILSECNPVCVLQEMAAVARDLEQWTPDPPAIVSKVLAIVDGPQLWADNEQTVLHQPMSH